MNEELTIKAVREGRTLIIRAKGRINTNTAPKFEEIAKANVEGAGRVVLDFTDLDYMSSAGIRVVLRLFNETGRERRRLIVRNPNTDIMDVLTITGFAERVTIERKAAKPAAKKSADGSAKKKEAEPDETVQNVETAEDEDTSAEIAEATENEGWEDDSDGQTNGNESDDDENDDPEELEG